MGAVTTELQHHTAFKIQNGRQVLEWVLTPGCWGFQMENWGKIKLQNCTLKRRMLKSCMVASCCKIASCKVAKGQVASCKVASNIVSANCNFKLDYPQTLPPTDGQVGFLSCCHSKRMGNNDEQAGELCQAQGKLNLCLPWLDPRLLWLTNMVLICRFGLWISQNLNLKCSVWKGFIPRFLLKSPSPKKYWVQKKFYLKKIFGPNEILGQIKKILI